MGKGRSSLKKSSRFSKSFSKSIKTLSKDLEEDLFPPSMAIFPPMVVGRRGLLLKEVLDRLERS